jgi:hypothetical protein
MNANPVKRLSGSGWEVTGIRIASDFFAAVQVLFPLPVHLCFEGTSIEIDVWELLNTRAVSALTEIPKGTIWPKPRTIHVLANEDFLRALSSLADDHAEPEICDHLHGYNESRILFEWYDAFDDPLFLDTSIPEARVREFCQRLGAKYKPHHPELRKTQIRRF